MKPCTHHTSAVVAAAFAINGRANVPSAASPTELWSTDLRVTLPMTHSFLLWRRHLLRRRKFLSQMEREVVRSPGQLLLSGVVWTMRPTDRDLTAEAGSLGRRASRDPCRNRRPGRCGWPRNSRS